MGVPGSANPLLLRSAGVTQYQVSRSLRFNGSVDNSYLSRTPASAGNRRTYTFAAWVKRSTVADSNNPPIFNGSSDASNQTALRFTSSDQLEFYIYNAASFAARYISTAVYRDLSAWYHIVLSVDTTNATSSDRIRLYVNGTRLTVFGTSTAPAQNTDGTLNTAIAHNIGRNLPAAGNDYFNGYLADIHFIDGQALDPSSFTEVSATTGQLVPKAYSGSFGTNGFKLTFSDNSAATAAALGKDSSGNGLNWTPNNLSVTAGAGNDSLVDTPTSYGTDTGAGGEMRGNYATLNPLRIQSTATLSNGNLDLACGATNFGLALGTIGVNSGKWYWEITCNSVSATGSNIGIADQSIALTTYPGGTATSYGYNANGSKFNNGGSSAYGASYTNADVIGVALDLDAGTLVFYKNGSSQGTAYSSLTGTFFPAVSAGGGNSTFSVNFGQRPFAYTAPSGFKALVDTNLTAPVIAKPNTVMDVVTYTGTGSSRSISTLQFSPDLVWMKGRSAATQHVLQNVISGTNKILNSASTDAELTDTTGIQSFDANGFSLGTGGAVNTLNATYVAWCFDAGSSTVTNTSGTISSQVRANASAGFSIISFTGNETVGATLGHGLGAKPGFAIFKDRNSSTRGFYCYHSSLGATQSIQLSSTAAASASSSWFNNTEPTSTIFTLANNSVINGASSMICWAWAPVAGYSSFGSYTGNGSTDGPFVFCNFRPRWILFKKSSSSANAQSWNIIDATRLGYNAPNYPLYAQSSSAEVANNTLDILSNGFKIRVGDAFDNENGATYIYAAFAESPFAYARAR